MSNEKRKELVSSLLKSFETGDTGVAREAISSKDFIQHNLLMASGRDAVLEHIKQSATRNTKVTVHRVFADGDYVFTHSEYRRPSGHEIGFDIFRFDESGIVEHWDNLQQKAPNNISGRSMIDGPVAVDKASVPTAKSRALTQQFADIVLVANDFDKIGNFFNKGQCIQHNPGLGDGLDALNRAYTALIKVGMPIIFTKTHFVLAEGNFGLSCVEGHFMDDTHIYYNLYRVEDDYIAEMWGTVEIIPPAHQWKNSNGKF